MLEILTLWIVVAIVAAIVASNKGRSGLGWFLLCVLLTPLAILILLVLPSLKPADPQVVRVIEGGDGQRRVPCPHCAELILPAATVCHFCSRELPAGWAPAQEPEPTWLRVGARVRHKASGVGEVTGIENGMVTVKFLVGGVASHSERHLQPF